MKGTYVKKGEVTEVVIGDGITEILPPEEKQLHALFYFMPKHEKKRKSLLHKALILASVAAPFVAAEFVALPLFAPVYALAVGWLGIVVYANVKGVTK